MAFIKEPKIPKFLNVIISFVERRMGAKMMPARLLLWTPKAFISSMILEGLITHKQGKVSRRILKLIRMQVSLRIACPFCIDMNSAKFKDFNITHEEIKAMQGRIKIKDVDSFTYREKIVLYYVRNITRTPIQINPVLVENMKKAFTEKEFVTIVTTVAQVDYWTRVIQGLGIRPAGFLETCDIQLFHNKNK